MPYHIIIGLALLKIKKKEGKQKEQQNGKRKMDNTHVIGIQEV